MKLLTTAADFFELRGKLMEKIKNTVQQLRATHHTEKWAGGRSTKSSITADWDLLHHRYLKRKYDETQKAAFTEQQQGQFRLTHSDLASV